MFKRAADDSHTRAARYAEPDGVDAAHWVRQDDQQAHHPPPPGPHCGREVGH
ncbi:hypothetical protein [Streptomyces sp. NPDC002104]